MQAFTNISKMQLMECDATGVFQCNHYVAFLVIMNGECFLVRTRNRRLSCLELYLYVAHTNHSSNVSTSGIGLKY